ncbi:MAG: extracellular solute-binding protein [Bacillota bacterium]|nr:extracellular solute-binding protein [Bacillota bacterium]
MKSSKVRVLASVLVILALLVSGCTTAGTTTTGATTGGTTTGSTTTTAPTQTGPAPYDLPFVDEPITLSLFVSLDGKAAMSLTSLEENLTMQHYEEISGINIEWYHPSSATTTAEALNVMIASGDVTDMIAGIMSASDSIDTLIENGIIMRLNEAIDEHGYYLNQAFTEYPEFYAQVLSYEGNIGLYPSARLDEITRYFESFIVRKDWLDELGLEKPDSVEDWYTVLKAFKTQDPNKNGKNDELPFVHNTNEELGVPRLSSLWGFNATFFKWNATTVLDGKVVFATDAADFVDYVTTMNKWYAEGLLDPEYVSTDATGWREKVLSDQGGMFYGKMNGGIGTLMGSYDFSKNANFSLEPVAYATTKDGKSYDVYSQDIFDRGGTAISANCENVEAAIKWNDYMYSKEGAIMASFGIEGTTFEYDDKGVPHYTELITKNPDGLSLVNAIAKYAIGGMGPRMLNDQYYWSAVMATEQQRMVYPTVSVSSTERKMPNNLLYSQEDFTELNRLMTDIGTYYKEGLHAFIMGTRPLSEMDAFKANLDKMGLKDAIAIMQDAYDRYISNIN